MNDKNGTKLKVGDRVLITLDFGFGKTTHKGVVAGVYVPDIQTHSPYEFHFREDGSHSECFVYATEAEKI